MVSRRNLYLYPQSTMAWQPGLSRVLVFVGLFLMAGGYYVYTVNVAAVAGYRLRGLEQTVTQLKDENARLRIAEADARSFSRIEGEREALSLIEVEQIRYYNDVDILARR